MKDLTFAQMHGMQEELCERHRGKWPPLEPDNGRNQLLWMLGEAGEVIDIIKKLGEEAIMQREDVRSAFVEEMIDILMYWNDVALCFGVGPQELADAYRRKHARNMGRDYQSEADRFERSMRGDI